MKEKKTVFKLFFVWDFEKEERWLNEMAQEGWVLDNTGVSFYTFVRCEPGEYIIRLEMNPSSDYRAFVKELGAEYIGGCVNWVYFRRKARNISAAASTGCTSVGKRSLAALSCSQISTPV